MLRIQASSGKDRSMGKLRDLNCSVQSNMFLVEVLYNSQRLNDGYIMSTEEAEEYCDSWGRVPGIIG